MSSSYLITIENDPEQEKDEILNYILTNVNIHNIDEIKCINAKEVGMICKNNIKQLGTIFKQKIDTKEICIACNDIFKPRQMIFSFNNCKHNFHKTCMTKHFKTCKTNICPCCKDKHLEKILTLI